MASARRQRQRTPPRARSETTIIRVELTRTSLDRRACRARGFTASAATAAHDARGRRVLTEFLCSNTRAATSSMCRCRACISSTRYSGASPEAPPLHRLGSTSGRRPSARPHQARDTAAELLNLYAQRAARAGTSSSSSTIQLPPLRDRVSVRGDRGPADRDRARARGPGSARPMDRVVCGDVGSARPRLRCARRSSPCRPASRSPCSCRRRCSRSSTIGRSWIGSPTGPCASSSCRAFAARARASALLEGLRGTVDIVIGTHKLL